MCSFDYLTFFRKMLYFPSLVAAILAFFKKIIPMYKVANATELLVMTGHGIEDVKLVRNGWVLPTQACSVMNISPVSYTMEFLAVTSDHLSFIIPVVFTIGPRNDTKNLQKYALLLSSYDMKSDYVKELLTEMIEGEILGHVASTSIGVILGNQKDFKATVLGNVRNVLREFGLKIYGVNFKPFLDAPGYNYLCCLRQKAFMEAVDGDMSRVSEIGEQWQKMVKKVDNNLKLCDIENDRLVAEAKETFHTAE